MGGGHGRRDIGLGGEKWEGGLRERARGIGREDMEGENWEGAWEEDHGSRRGDMGGLGGHGRMNIGLEERYGRGDMGLGWETWERGHGRREMGGGIKEGEHRKEDMGGVRTLVRLSFSRVHCRPLPFLPLLLVTFECQLHLHLLTWSSRSTYQRFELILSSKATSIF